MLPVILSFFGGQSGNDIPNMLSEEEAAVGHADSFVRFRCPMSDHQRFFLVYSFVYRTAGDLRLAKMKTSLSPFLSTEMPSRSD